MNTNEKKFLLWKIRLSQMEPSRDSHLFRSSHSGSSIFEISDGKVLLWLKFSAGCSEQLFYTKMAPQKKTFWKNLPKVLRTPSSFLKRFSDELLQNFLTLCHITTSITEVNYYHAELNVRVASRVTTNLRLKNSKP